MQEPDSEERTSQEKPATSKRTSRQGRNRPVLVTSSSIENTKIQEPVEEQKTNQSVEETIAATIPEAPRTRRLPGFFSKVGKSESVQESEANAAGARLARATRGKAPTQASGQSAESSIAKNEKKQETREPVRNTSASARPTARAASPFKFRYIWGMMLYLLVADFVGAFEANYLRANHLEALVFTLGPLIIYRSTLLFLLTLGILLVVLARFDLIPRNLGAMMGTQSGAQGKGGSSQNTAGTTSTKTLPPSLRQGVKGADDDLYEEYQAQRRYNQRRERKR